ncbi:hypothetical protein ANN_24270, partial [Periplaneta americana]
LIQIRRQEIDYRKEKQNGSLSRKKLGKGASSLLVCSTYKYRIRTVIRVGELDDINVGIRTDDRRINNIRYADDTTLTTGNKQELEKLIRVSEKSNKAGLKLNVKKTSIMTTEQDTLIKVNGEDLTVLDKINFLGVTISKVSSCMEEIKKTNNSLKSSNEERQ